MFATEFRRAKARRKSSVKKPQIALVTPARLPASQGDLSPRIQEYLATHEVASPCLVIDVDMIEHTYLAMNHALPGASVYYAVKANPAAEVITRLSSLGANFDVASPGEIDLCIKQGVDAARLSYGNTIKKQADIAYAYAQGVRMFAFDSAAELDKIAVAAPGTNVYCRILMESEGAEWPLSRKFGCEEDMALDLLLQAREKGLKPLGISFHVGSQQTNLNAWDVALGRVSALFARARAKGLELTMVNMGGGMPARYTAGVHGMEKYAQVIEAALTRHFGDNRPTIIMEPGRSLVGDAGVIQAEVVLVSRKSDDDPKRWVYLDIGKFSGLAETMDESIKYRFVTPHDGGQTGPVVIAGPTCDSADILYEHTAYELPLDLKAGDKVLILSTGAYTTTYSSVAFNGFDPLAAVCI